MVATADLPDDIDALKSIILPDPDFGSEDLPANKTALAELIEDTGAHMINYL